MISLDSIFSQTSTIDNLIAQYMALESKPLTDLQTRKSELNIRRGMYSDLGNYLEQLSTLVEELANTEDESIFNTVTVTSSDTDKLTASGSAGAALGNYHFRVRQLATATSTKSTAALNTAPSVSSSAQVVAGTGSLDLDESWADAGFDSTPDGSITINGQTFTLSDYDTVEGFLEAVNEDATAAATIYYDSTRDKFFIESDAVGEDLVISETPEANGFLTEINIAAGTYSTNTSGLRTDVYLYQVNFDTAVAEADEGSFKINGATISWDADDDTFNDIITRINNSSAGVTAFYDDTLDKIIITANETGSEEIAMEDVSGTLLMDTLKFSGAPQSTGEDALFTINSTSADDEITKSSNTFTINGITYTLKAITVANDDYEDADTTYVTTTSVKNSNALQNKINAFLGSFNRVTSYIKAKSMVDTNTYSRGAMSGQTIFTNLRGSLINILVDKVAGVEEDKPTTLAEIGITLDDTLTASLADASALSEWLEADPQAVEDLFNSTYGVATRMEQLLEPYTDSHGIVEDQKDYLSDEVERIEDRIDRTTEQLKAREEYYRKQLTSMQEAFYELAQQQSILESLFGSTS